jgi:hypothetical protein
VENALLLIDAVRNSEAWDYGDHEYFEAALLPEINDPDVSKRKKEHLIF